MNRLLLYRFTFVLSLFLFVGGLDAQVPTNGLVAEYTFTGNAQDGSGNNNHGTVNGATLTTDRFGNCNSAYSFDGVNDEILLNYNFGPYSELTISSWIYINSFVNNSFQAIISTNAVGQLVHFQLNTPTGGSGGYINSGSGNISMQNLLIQPTGRWRHIVQILSSGNSKIYEDGVEISSSSTLFGSINATNLLKIGSGFQNSRFLNGKIDDVRMYSRALTTAEVLQLYNAPNTGNSIPTVSITPSSSALNCTATSVTLTASAAQSYLWSNGATTASITANAAGTYAVTATLGPNCTATASIAISSAISQEICNDGIDNDCDNLVDCADTDCTNAVLINENFASPTTLSNYGITNSGTGAVLSIAQNRLNVRVNGGSNGFMGRSDAVEITPNFGGAFSNLQGKEIEWDIQELLIDSFPGIKMSVAAYHNLVINNNTSLYFRIRGNHSGYHPDPAFPGSTYYNQWRGHIIDGYSTLNGVTTYFVLDRFPIGQYQHIHFKLRFSNGVWQILYRKNNQSAYTTYNSTINIATNAQFKFGFASGDGGNTSRNGIGEWNVNYLRLLSGAAMATTAAVATSICPGQNTTLSSTVTNCATCGLQWQLNGNNIATATSGTYGATQGGVYRLVVTNANGCTAVSNAITLTQSLAPTLTATASSNSICAPQNVTLTASAPAGSTFAWSGGLGSAASAVVSVTASTTYRVTVTNAAGCTATASVGVSIGGRPNVSITSTLGSCGTTCTGSFSTTISGGAPPYSYNWSNGGNTATLSGLCVGLYSLTVTEAGGCTATASSGIQAPAPLGLSNKIKLLFNGNALDASGFNNHGQLGGSTLPVYVADRFGNPNSALQLGGFYNPNWVRVPNNANMALTNQMTVSMWYKQCDFGGMDGWGRFSPTGYHIAFSKAGDGIAARPGFYSGISTNAQGTVGIGFNNTYNADMAIDTSLACIDLCEWVHYAVVVDVNVIKFYINGRLMKQRTSSNVNFNNANSEDFYLGRMAGGGTIWYPFNGVVDDVHFYTTALSNADIACLFGDYRDPLANDYSFNILSASVQTSACTGGSATVTLNADPAEGPFQYSRNGGTSWQASNVFVGVTPGTYSFKIKNNCNIEDTTIVIPAGFSATATSSSNCNGTTIISSAVGRAPFAYTWSNGASTAAITALTSGTYRVTVSDANGCTGTAARNVTVTPPPTPSLGANQTFCSGGSATLNPGTFASYRWQDGSTASTLVATTSGNYSVTVTDTNGCRGSASVSLTFAPSGMVLSTNATPARCAGACDGTASVTVTGGQLPYTFRWSGNRTGASISALCAGNYTATVSDALGCTITGPPVTVTQPTVLSATSAAGSIACNGGTTNVTVTPSGGTSPYNIAGNRTGLVAGVYTFTVTDANACSVTTSITVTQPTALSATSAAGSIACNGGTTNVTVTPSGGTSPYTIAGNRTGLVAGVYTFTVTDANACSVTTSITVTQPTALSATSAGPNILCNGGTTQITVTGAGGTPAYTGTGVFARPVGIHTFTVTDANGCQTTTSITITQPTALAATSVAGSIACNSGTTNLTISASGGTGAYTGTGVFVRSVGTHTFTVTDANGCSTTTSVTITQPSALTATSVAGAILCNGGSTNVTVSAAGGTSAYTGTGVFVRNAGTHTFTVTDANGCSATTSVTITEPTTISATSAASGILCFGGTSNITVTGAGGTPPYTGAGLFTRMVGVHTFTVTDANGCSITTSITITEPTALSATAVSGSISCNGGSTNVTVTGAGGTVPYSFTGITVRGAGVHVFTVTDVNTCSVTTSLTITEPTAISITSLAGNILCNGGSTNVTISASGGTPAYTGTGVFVRNAGTHTFTVTDANGCFTTASVTITEPTVLTATSSGANVLCFGGTTSITVTGAGGTPPYTGAGLFTRTFGVHTFTVTDANGCSTTTSITITEPTALSATSVSSNILCNGGTANVTISAAGGTAAYAGIGVFARAVGSHTFTVTDANGCSVVTSTTLTEPRLLQASVTQTSPNRCAYTCEGTALANANGGTAPYQYLWGSGGQATASATALCNGNNTFTVTDANGCSTTAALNITTSSNLSLSVSTTAVSCYGYRDGTATAFASLGIAPISYAWADGSVGVFAAGQAAGVVTVRAFDGLGCTAIASGTVQSPTPISANISITDATCFASNDGTARVVPAGGTAPYTYRWSNGHTSAFIGGLRPNNPISVLVYDANGCHSASVFTVTVSEGTPIFIFQNTSVAASCFGYADGQASVSVTGARLPLAYLWENGQNGAMVSGLNAGTYRVSITDGLGCTGTGTASVAQPSRLEQEVSVTNVTCPDARNGRIELLPAMGGTPPYSIRFNNQPSISFPGSRLIDGLAGGTYPLTLSDANGCTLPRSINVQEPASFGLRATPSDTSINLGSSVQLQAYFAVPSRNNIYAWSGAEGICPNCTRWSVTPLENSRYTFRLQTDNGCSDSVSVNINVIPTQNVFIPNSFTPNGDGGNDFFTAYGGIDVSQIVQAHIFDRWGGEVFSANNIPAGAESLGWDGTVNGEPAELGVYVYFFEIEFINGKRQMFKGDVTLLR